MSNGTQPCDRLPNGDSNSPIDAATAIENSLLTDESSFSQSDGEDDSKGFGEKSFDRLQPEGSPEANVTPSPQPSRTRPSPNGSVESKEIAIVRSVSDFLATLELALTNLAAMGDFQNDESSKQVFADISSRLNDWQHKYQHVQKTVDVLDDLYTDCAWDVDGLCWKSKYDHQFVVNALQRTIADVREAQRLEHQRRASERHTSSNISTIAQNDGSFADLVTFGSIQYNAVVRDSDDRSEPAANERSPVRPGLEENTENTISPPSGASSLMALRQGASQQAPELVPSRFCFVFGQPLANTWKQASGSTTNNVQNSYVSEQEDMAPPSERQETGAANTGSFAANESSRRLHGTFLSNCREPKPVPVSVKQPPRSSKRKSIPVVDKDEESDDEQSRNKRIRGCNCKKSKCLKLYCDCFASKAYCTPSCNCQNCINDAEHTADVAAAQQLALDRNSAAFKPKLETTETGDAARHLTGCNCKKSSCTKNYCECFQSKVPCTEACRCQNCQNCGECGPVPGRRPPAELDDGEPGEDEEPPSRRGASRGGAGKARGSSSAAFSLSQLAELVVPFLQDGAKTDPGRDESDRGAESDSRRRTGGKQGAGARPAAKRGREALVDDGASVREPAGAPPLSPSRVDGRPSRARRPSEKARTYVEVTTERLARRANRRAGSGSSSEEADDGGDLAKLSAAVREVG
jgi:hypothetical protein